jgi:hypothetical protein
MTREEKRVVWDIALRRTMRALIERELLVVDTKKL